MAWVAVDESGAEGVYQMRPIRKREDEDRWWGCIGDYEFCTLPRGSIKKLIGRTLTWYDNPVELKEEEEE